MSQRPGSKRNQTRKSRRSGGTQRTTNQASKPQATRTEKTGLQGSQTAPKRGNEPGKRTSRKAAAQAQAKKKQQLQLIIGGVAAALVIVVAFILINRPTASGVKIDYTGIAQANSAITDASGTPAADSYPTNLTWATGSTIGDPNAKVTMHIFSDFQCHFCQGFHNDVLPKIVDDFVRDGKLKIVFHDFPRLGSNPNVADPNDLSVELRDPNNESSLAAQAVMCAGEQDKYLEMTDKVFANFGQPQTGKYSRDNLTRFAKDLGLDTDALNACMDSGKYVPVLAASLQQGQANGITATPMFVLDNGSGDLNVLQNTAEGYDLMKKQIEVSIETAP